MTPMTSMTLTTMKTRSSHWLSTIAAAAVALAGLGAFGREAFAQNEPPPKFAAIFNGKDLAGWRGGNTFDPAKLAAMPEAGASGQIEKWTASMKEHWRVDAGELVNDGKGDYATTEKDFGNFELLVDYKTVAGADSASICAVARRCRSGTSTSPAARRIPTGIPTRARGACSTTRRARWAGTRWWWPTNRSASGTTFAS